MFNMRLLQVKELFDQIICLSWYFYNSLKIIHSKFYIFQYSKYFQAYYLMLLLLFISLVQFVLPSQVYLSPFTFPQTNVFTKSSDLTSLYAVGTSDFKVYRMNYTRYFTTVSYSYTTSHTKKVRSIALSKGQRFFATGSEDYTIQVVEVYTKNKFCKFSNYNQVRSVLFHPYYQEILYSGSVDDAIRKWNITNCSMLTEKSVGGSVHVMSINPDGTFLSYGTYEGHVGIIDQNLSSYTLNSNPHQFTVKYMFSTYNNFFISIGDDNKINLWNKASLIHSLTSLSSDKITVCGLFQQSQLNSTHRIFGCQDSGQYCLTFRTTNSTIFRFTNHACSQTVSWIDFRQLSMDQQVWVLHYGTNLQIEKIFDNNSVICNTNNNHTAVDPIYRTCRFCGYNYPGCHFCTLASGCTTCGIGSYQVGNNCTSCPLQCSDCTSATNCNNCAVGYEQIGSSGKCRIATNPQPGCFLLTNSGSKCQIAANGYFVNSGNICKPCNQTMTACMECTVSTNPQCLTCKLGYFLNSSSCSPCLSGCLACLNQTDCLKCSVAFKYSGSNLQCSNCHQTCQTCSTFYDQCLTCYSTQNRYLNGTACMCLEGYYDNSASGNYTCPKCNTVLTSCYLCTNNTICIQCQTNYYTYTNAGKKQCQKCQDPCQTCSGASTNCTTCNTITYHRVQSGSTCLCDVGYVSINSSLPCFSCSRLNDGCTSCVNQTYCSSCDTGYYLSTISSSSKLCSLCPYFCPDCTNNPSGSPICNSCPAGTFRTLVNGTCVCNSGYFDDNRTLICQKCSDVLTNCLNCQNRTKCTTCAPGLYTDQSLSFCAPCQATCLTCGTYFDTCSTCDPSSNRVILNNRCVCQSFAFQADGICKLCGNAIKNCNSCENPYICTGCISGFTLSEDLKSCIDCKGSINGCNTCLSQTNCTTCLNPFSLIRNKCRCPIDQYTYNDIWGTCKSYGIPTLKSSLGVQIEVHQHQNNTIVVFIRFRAKTLYILNKKIENSISMYINGELCQINFDYIKNNRIKVSTQLEFSLQKPVVTISFEKDVFYNEYLLTLDSQNQTAFDSRFYFYEQPVIKTYQSIRDVLKYTFFVFKWVFLGVCILGQGHLLFPFIIFIQLMPIFLMLKMSLPANLSMVLDSMLTFQVKSIIPLFNISSNFFVLFPPITYDYYGLFDFLLFGKVGDILLIVLINVLTKFDQGIVRMFPPGKIRRYLYQSLVRKGYSVMSLCILSFQPSLILLASKYITYAQWQSTQQIFNFCCCLFAFGFYLGYNFNHASNLQGSKLMKNIENQHCFFGINSQQRSAAKTTLLVLATDIWIMGSLPLIGPIPYFTSSIFFLLLRFLVHLRPMFYIGKFQFICRISTNLFMLGIFCLMFTFWLGQNHIYISVDTAEKLGLASTILIFSYILFYIIQKIVYNLKLETDYLKTKVVQGANGQKIVVAKADQQGQTNKGNMRKENEDSNEIESTHSKKMNQYFQNATTNMNKGFSGLNFRNRNKNGQVENSKEDSNHMIGNNMSNASYQEGDKDKESKSIHNKSDIYFNNGKHPDKQQKDKYSRIKSANTSKYAKNHLELREKAQAILTRKADKYDD